MLYYAYKQLKHRINLQNNLKRSQKMKNCLENVFESLLSTVFITFCFAQKEKRFKLY